MDVGNHGACSLNFDYSAGLVYILFVRERLEIVDMSQKLVPFTQDLGDTL